MNTKINAVKKCSIGVLISYPSESKHECGKIIKIVYIN